MREFLVVLLLGSFSPVMGQFFNILSDSCNKALGQLFGVGPAANCLNTPGLLNVMTTPSGQSWVGPLDIYMGQTCSQPACTNETMNATIDSLIAGCSADLMERNWSPSDMSELMTRASQYYPAFREMSCLRDTTTQQLCITTLLNQIQEMSGQLLNVGTLIQHTPEVLRNHNITIPKNISCTQCTQAAYTLARPSLPSDNSVQAWDKFWINQCGQDFISGTIPTSIAQTANQTTETPQPSNAVLSTAVPTVGMLASLALVLVSMLSVILRG